jgi:hypothetical protein
MLCTESPDVKAEARTGAPTTFCIMQLLYTVHALTLHRTADCRSTSTRVIHTCLPVTIVHVWWAFLHGVLLGGLCYDTIGSLDHNIHVQWLLANTIEHVLVKVSIVFTEADIIKRWPLRL